MWYNSHPYGEEEMRFTSTRSSIVADSLHTVLRDLAPDGGLYVPEEVPRFPSLAAADCLAGPERMALGALFDDIPEEDTLFCHGLFGDQDELTAGGREIFERHFPGMSRSFSGGHRLNADTVKSALLPLIRELLSL